MHVHVYHCPFYHWFCLSKLTFLKVKIALGCGSVVECLPSMGETRSSIPSTKPQKYNVSAVSSHKQTAVLAGILGKCSRYREAEFRMTAPSQSTHPLRTVSVSSSFIRSSDGAALPAKYVKQNLSIVSVTTSSSHDSMFYLYSLAFVIHL